MRRPWLVALATLIGLGLLAATGTLNLERWSSFAIFFVIQASIYALLTLGLRVQWGSTGLFNLGVSSLFALGAYTSALLTKSPIASAGELAGAGLPFGVGLLGGMLVASVAAVVLGAFTLRLRGDYLAMVTLGAGEIIQLILMNEEPLTHGPEGLRAIPQPWHSLLPPKDYNFLYGVIVLTALVLGYLLLKRLVRSPWGRALRAVRDDEEAAEALGKHVFRFKLQAFVVGSALMGLAGGLYAHFTTFISPADFEPLQTFIVWMMLIVGGSTSNRGATGGAYLIWGLWVGTSVLSGLFPSIWAVKFAYVRVIAIGLTLQWILIKHPQGVWGEHRRSRG